MNYISSATINNKVVPYFSYHHESPILEIYEDEALTKRIGELSLEKLTPKQL